MSQDPRAIRTRARLLEGAEKALGRQGLRTATVEDVVRAAGVSRRTFYQYFRDKEDILSAVYDGVVADLHERVHAAVDAAEGPVARLFAALDAYLEHQQEGGRFVGELQAEAAAPGSALWPARERAVADFVGLLDAEVRAASGLSLDHDVYAMLINGLEALVIQHRRSGPFAPDDRAHVSEVAKAIFLTTLASAGSLPQRG